MRCSLLSRACWWHAVPRLRHDQYSVRCCSHFEPSLKRTDGVIHKASDLFKEGKAFTLERAINTQLGLDHQLWDTRAFQFSVYPDLPKIMHWSDLFKFRNVLTDPDLQSLPGALPDRYIVRTVGVQLSGPEAVAQRLHARAGVARDGAPLQDAAAADALLLVSGSHALRPAFSWTGALQDSTSALQIARSQREQGGLPNTLSLWAVSNPLRDSPDSVLRKVEAGAEVILTQPPLLKRQFEAWYEGLIRSGVMDAAHVVIGACMLTSARSADFWLRLCSARHLEGAEALIAAFVKAEEAGKAALQQHSYEHAKAQVRQALQLPGVAGMHVMPVSKAGRRLAMQLAKETVLQK